MKPFCLRIKASEAKFVFQACNRGFDMTLESFTTLKTEGVLSDDFVQQQIEIAEELRAGINHMILNRLESREAEDWAHYGQMKNKTTEGLKTSTPS